MEEASKASEEARRRLGEIEQRLSRLDAEIAAMRASAEADAAAEEQLAASVAVHVGVEGDVGAGIHRGVVVVGGSGRVGSTACPSSAPAPSSSRTAGIFATPLAWVMRLASPATRPIFAQKRTFD